MGHLLRTVLVLAVLLLLIGHTRPVFAQEDTSDLFEASFGHETAGNYTTALNNVLKILQKEPDNYTAYLRAGWLAYMLGRYKDSVKYYEKAIVLRPDSIEAKLGISLPFIGMQDWNAAEKAVRDAMKADPLNYYANSRLAWILFSQGRYSEALAAYTKVHKWYPSDIEMQLGLGWTYLKMGNKKMARKYFEMVLKVRQNNVRAIQGMNALDK